MADAPKTVRGTLVDGTTVQVSEETAAALGMDFTPEGSKTTKKAASSSSKSTSK